MTEENQESLNLPTGDAPAPEAQPAPRARRNTRRTPRKSIEDSTIVYEGLAPAPTPRPRRRREVTVEESAPVVPPSAPAPTLSDEIEPPVIIVPRRPVEEDVPTSFSSDDEPEPQVRAPAPEPQAPADEPQRRERRTSRFGRDDFRGGRYERPVEDRRGNEPREADSSRDDNRSDRAERSEEGDRDSRDDRDVRDAREEQDSRDDRDGREDRDARDDNADHAERGDDSAEDSRDGRDSDDRENSDDDRDDAGAEERDESDDSGEDSERRDEAATEGEGESRQGGDSGRRDNRDYQQGYGRDRNFRPQGGGFGNQHGGAQGNYNDRHLSKRQKYKLKKQMKYQQGGYQQGPAQGQSHAQSNQGVSPSPRPQAQNAPAPQSHGWERSRRRNEFSAREENAFIEIGDLPELEALREPEGMEKLAAEHQGGGEPVDLVQLLTANIHDVISRAKGEFALTIEGMPLRSALVEMILNAAWDAKRPILAEGVVELSQEGWGLLTYTHDSYRVKPLCAFIPKVTMKRWGLKRGHIVKGVLQPPRRDLSLDGNKENCPALLKVETVMGRDPTLNLQTTVFEELTPYYPTERFLLETSPDVKWDNVSMRVVDLLTPVGKGQRGLIVAPPRTGKTILQQGIANAIMRNNPESHLIVLLVDERPEEVTDFRRQIVRGEVIASTFDENAESHVHAAEMVIEKARRMVEVGIHVVILLDSITRLARAYNALAGNSGKILSGGVEATAMQKPKRFFGSARNIEGGGSLTILGTALVETGSRMDEVIFEEFKGTGNMELVLDRELVNKRIFPAINLEKSGTRKEELLYHPDEMIKVYGLRRAMKGVPSPDAMEMLITRVKKTKTNIEFLMGLNR